MGTARDRWLDEGIRVLAQEGAAGVRIDRIAARLGLSKGSFHHHFDGADGYKRDLLARFERLSIDQLDRAIVEAGPTSDARSILSRLTALIEPREAGLYRPELDVAVRAWSASDPEVRAAQARIDEARLAALQRVWRPYVTTDAEARTAALLPYLLAVGASVVSPPVAADELRGLFETLLPLVPEGPVDPDPAGR
ncbi:TetR/AcrR family transcriptional regulator [Occultella aeris]|uniref:Bacterial regulatory proteins, tetR family n=1 Tax=Occultella aeris TaxID=2761496 RepID=A0A7M4DID0_9MICO|nr:TetR/AcrR family transcriptional regulator [Occultella aeris]VZO36702.1 Bacterial regulatory proteins, tetR family [Occultella aeris]